MLMERYSSYKDSGEKWLGMIPGHWEMVRWRYLMSENCVQNTNCKVTNQLQFKYGEIVQKNNQDTDSDVLETISKYTVVEPNDIMINGLNLNYDFISQRVGEVTQQGVITSAYISLRPTYKANHRYLLFLLKAMDSQKLFHGMGSGVRVTLSYKELKNKFLPIPSDGEQRAIVSYLDRVTGDIDRAIAESQRMIDLLNERKQIIIQHAVTKGLNPNAKLKYSGVEWIGEVPEGWEVRKLKYCCSIKGRVGWNGLSSKEFESSSYAYLVTGQDFKGDEIVWSNCYQINKRRYDEDPFIQLQEGDILVTKDGSIGKIAKVKGLDKPACLNSGIFILKQKMPLFSQDYLFWMLRSNVLKEFNRYTQTGATILRNYSAILCLH